MTRRILDGAYEVTRASAILKENLIEVPSRNGHFATMRNYTGCELEFEWHCWDLGNFGNRKLYGNNLGMCMLLRLGSESENTWTSTALRNSSP